MAEAVVNVRLADRWDAFSAGSRPKRQVHPMAIQVLSEVGIEHHGTPKLIDEFRGQAFDIVITLCDDSATDCPIWLGKGRQLHYPFPDPATVTGNAEQILQAFRQVRDAIIAELIPLLTG